MKKKLTVIGIVAVLAVILAACSSPQATPTQAPATVKATNTAAPTKAAQLEGDPIRGGKLYDSYYSTLEIAAADRPTDNEPLWADQTTNTRTGATTWRCAECHGYDYLGKDGEYAAGSHATGFPGVSQDAGKDASAILAILQGKSDPKHDFTTIMDTQALTDIALFIQGDQMAGIAKLAGSDKKAAGGDVANGKKVYEGNCMDCHGPQGNAINFSTDATPNYIGTYASSNPIQFIHRARFGQPDFAGMPSMVDVGLSDPEYLDLLAYAQSLPASSPVAEGGRLFDNWITATGAKVDGDQPLWATQTVDKGTGTSTWRCVACHGYDYLGNKGQYATGSHATGFPGILSAKDKSEADLLAALKSNDHDFSTYLKDPQLNALVAFMKQMQDMSPYINADKTVKGDTNHGKALYNGLCAKCHGEDGKAIDFDTTDAVEYVGTVANNNPWQLFGRISYGVAGSHMPSGVNEGWTAQDIADILNFTQTLATK